MKNLKSLIKSNLIDRSGDESSLANIDYLSEKYIEGVRSFHKAFGEYAITPLHSLDKLAKHYGIRNIFVKDESYRFGLNAFKVLGASYAMARYLAERLDMDIGA